MSFCHLYLINFLCEKRYFHKLDIVMNFFIIIKPLPDDSSFYQFNVLTQICALREIYFKICLKSRKSFAKSVYAVFDWNCIC